MSIQVKATLSFSEGSYIVSFAAKDASLPAARRSISCNSKKLADRCVAAINAQKGVSNVSVCIDINGVKYLTGDFEFMGRRLNADLNRLGF